MARSSTRRVLGIAIWGEWPDVWSLTGDRGADRVRAVYLAPRGDAGIAAVRCTAPIRLIDGSVLLAGIEQMAPLSHTGLRVTRHALPAGVSRRAACRSWCVGPLMTCVAPAPHNRLGRHRIRRRCERERAIPAAIDDKRLSARRLLSPLSYSPSVRMLRKSEASCCAAARLPALPCGRPPARRSVQRPAAHLISGRCGVRHVTSPDGPLGWSVLCECRSPLQGASAESATMSLMLGHVGVPLLA